MCANFSQRKGKYVASFNMTHKKQMANVVDVRTIFCACTILATFFTPDAKAIQHEPLFLPHPPAPKLGYFPLCVAP